MPDGSTTLSVWTRIWLPIAIFAGCYGFAIFDTATYQRIADGELGFLENLQVLTLIVCIVLTLRLLSKQEVRTDRLLFGWLVLALLATIYVLGEEISWGQHYFGWDTPEAFSEINRQNETNLHNTSSWLNEKPRSLLEIAVIVGGIIGPIVVWLRGRPLVSKPWWLMPTADGFVVAILAELARVPERLDSIGITYLPLLVARFSELQEFFFYVFLLIYLESIRRRLKPA